MKSGREVDELRARSFKFLLEAARRVIGGVMLLPYLKQESAFRQ
jgi:hypothetical protein